MGWGWGGEEANVIIFSSVDFPKNYKEAGSCGRRNIPVMCITSHFKAVLSGPIPFPIQSLKTLDNV